MRDRLIELLKNVPRNTRAFYGQFADYLLKNGVIVPPCKVGQTVYCVDNSPRYAPILECEVVEIGIDKNGTYIIAEIKINRGLRRGYSIEQICKTVFLTREEAEEKLKGR